jgi:hypothetical protein
MKGFMRKSLKEKVGDGMKKKFTKMLSLHGANLPGQQS